jgi:Short C-terminal domain
VQRLTDQGWQKILELSERYGVSTDAVMAMLQSVMNGNGTMAQFYHPELGGGGQWMQGGMTMVGDMFNYGLKSKVDDLCTELSQLLAQQPFAPPPVSNQSQWQGGQQQSGSAPVSLFVPGPAGGYGSWWPAELGSPNGSGGQNNVRYAYFSTARRLAVEINGHVTVYDTLDHHIGGVSQQQGVGGSVTLSSQYGTVDIATLPVVSVDGVAPEAPTQNFGLQNAQQSSTSNVVPPSAPEPQQYNSPVHRSSSQEADIFARIERLAELQQKGILSQEEYVSKKAELLSRI